MSDEIREAFRARVGDAATLHHATLRQVNQGAVLDFTGFYADGTPFAFISAPFRGCPIRRTHAVAEDLLIAHTGIIPPDRCSMPAPMPIKGLATTLREHLTKATERANNTAERALVSVTNLHSVLDTADSVVKEIDDSAADIQAALGLSTNGGPPLEDA